MWECLCVEEASLEWKRDWRYTREKEELLIEQGPRATGKDSIMLPISHMGLGKGAIHMDTQELSNAKHHRCPYEICLAPFNYILCRDLSKRDEFIF